MKSEALKEAYILVELHVQVPTHLHCMHLVAVTSFHQNAVPELASSLSFSFSPKSSSI